MTTFSKVIFTESVLGEPIRISATTSVGDLIHDVVDGYVNMDEVWLYASNTTSTDVIITVQLGDVQASSEVVQTVAAQSVSLIIPGIPIQGDGKIRAYAGTTDVINVFGWINRITV